jgi:hypothetical protein
MALSEEVKKLEITIENLEERHRFYREKIIFLEGKLNIGGGMQEYLDFVAYMASVRLDKITKVNLN